MTKEKIIETFYNNAKEYISGYGFVLSKKGLAKFADELLEFINKELSERLEKLHTEMDERMREEVAIEKRMGEKKAEKLLNQIEELTTGKCALRCPLVEQEKKKAVENYAKELIRRTDYTDANDELWFTRELLGIVAEKYGVEL